MELHAFGEDYLEAILMIERKKVRFIQFEAALAPSSSPAALLSDFRT